MGWAGGGPLGGLLGAGVGAIGVDKIKTTVVGVEGVEGVRGAQRVHEGCGRRACSIATLRQEAAPWRGAQ